jgi:predicted nucleotidyltransferase
VSGLASSWRALAERLVAEYRDALREDLIAVAVFGSVARGAAGPSSGTRWPPRSGTSQRGGPRK